MFLVSSLGDFSGNGTPPLCDVFPFKVNNENNCSSLVFFFTFFVTPTVEGLARGFELYTDLLFTSFVEL